MDEADSRPWRLRLIHITLGSNPRPPQAMNPQAATGVLFRVGDGKSRFLGTCFAFRRSSHILTAAHCIGDLPAANLAIGLPHVSTDGAFTVDQVHRHPSADLAVLRLTDGHMPPVEPFWGSVGNYAWGEDFAAFGFPEDVLGPDAAQPKARMLRGHIQRYLEHKSHFGYEYRAAELSTGCPGGLSGGPVFRPTAPPMLLGIATENHKSTTFLEATEEVTKDGVRLRTEFQSVINYGIALLLDPLKEWLDECVPPK